MLGLHGSSVNNNEQQYTVKQRENNCEIYRVWTNLGETEDFLVIVLLTTYQYQLIVQLLQIFVLQVFYFPALIHYLRHQ